MRIGVVGVGGVGGAIAAVLHRSGHEVEVTARGAQLAAIAAGGIRLRGAWGSHEARVGAAERLSGTAELVIVTTKAQDAAAAVVANRDAFGGAPVLIVQNGLGGLQAANALLPGTPVVGGLAMFAASYLSPGEVTITTGGHTYLGGDDPAAAQAVAEILGPVMPVSVVADFASAQWTKLVVNQVNALPAITGLSVQEVIADRRLRYVLSRSIRENVRVGHASGVAFATLGGLSDAGLRAIARSPLWVAQVLPLLMRRRMGATPNPGSTLQSLRRGQLSEIDFLNGAVVSAGRDAGVPTPVNAALVELVHEVERGGGFIAPAAVAARVAGALS